MQVTKKLLDQYIGGQVDIQNGNRPHMRGEIRDFRVGTAGVINYCFIGVSWMAEAGPGGWSLYERNGRYDVSLAPFVGRTGDDGQLILEWTVEDWKITLHRPGASTLIDPSSVQGLWT